MSDPLAWMSNMLGTGSDAPVRTTPPLPGAPIGPLASQIATANVPVTVFAACSIVNVADIINPVPLLPGQAYRVSSPLRTPVTAVAATAGHSFVAVSY